MNLALPEFLDNSASIISEDQKGGSSDIIIWRDPQSNDTVCKSFVSQSKKILIPYVKTQDQIMQEITASGIVSKEFSYAPNPFTSSDNETFLAFISNVDKASHCIYVQPDDHIKPMERLSEDLE